jgi:hypothetical protein
MITRESVDEFKMMIDQAVDREEFETLRQMLLESNDLTFAEKEQLSNYMDIRSRQVPELRSHLCKHSRT